MKYPVYTKKESLPCKQNQKAIASHLTLVILTAWFVLAGFLESTAAKLLTLTMKAF